jgi:hypothetical protein
MKFEELFQPKPGSVAAEMQKTIDGLNKEIKELRAENAALREDSTRLDWLARNRSVSSSERPLGVTPESLRAAIDAARKEAQP